MGPSTQPDNHNSKQKKSSKKHARQNGMGYYTAKGKFVSAIVFKDHKCTCRYTDCKTATLEEKKDVFKKFWEIGCWQTQEIFIRQTILVEETKRKTANSNKKYSRKYFINKLHVCKEVYLKTLGIKNTRVDYCLNVKSKSGMCSPDKRGKQPSVNKTSTTKIEKVKKFLKDMPKFQSHYSESEREYFHPDLTRKKIYTLYKETFPEDVQVKYKIFESVLKELNIKIYVPRTDTCKTCDNLNIKIKATEDEATKITLITQRSDHHQRAQHARDQLKLANVQSKNNPNLLAFTFDLERTQPLPHINTSVAFYKRQLWLYNLGINTCHNNQGYMCVWLESEGKRGSREICSSIYTFLNTQQLLNVKHIKTFSDCCGGQNRNKAVISFMMWACVKFTIETWEHRFLESGHTFLPNDSDFAVIEKKKKHHSEIFTKKGWIDLIKECQYKKPFIVHDMKNQFKEVQPLVEDRTFAKKNGQGQEFNFLKLNWYKVSIDSDIVQFRTSDSGNVKEIAFPKKSESLPDSLEEADVSELKIAQKKYDDLETLLPYVPPIYHQFYRDLPH